MKCSGRVILRMQNFNHDFPETSIPKLQDCDNGNSLELGDALPYSVRRLYTNVFTSSGVHTSLFQVSK